jgi:hypothetical protein
VATLIGAIHARQAKKSHGFQIGFEFRSVNSTPAWSLREDGGCAHMWTPAVSETERKEGALATASARPWDVRAMRREAP